MLAVPLKKPTDAEVVKPLEKLVQNAYNSSTAAGAAEGAAPAPNYHHIVKEFAKLRNTAIWKFYDKYESSLEVVYG